MNRRLFLAGSCGVYFASVTRAGDDAQQDQLWGDLKGRFVFDGEPPRPVRLKVEKDAVILKEPLFDESLLVDAKNRGLANVVVMLKASKTGEVPPVHPSYAASKDRPAKTTFQGLAIQPRVTVLQTGQEYQFVNNDILGHAPRWDLLKNQPPSGIIIESQTITQGYKHAESAPVSICCSIHPWESAVLVVTDYPYVGITQADGSFAIKNLPVGTWQFQLWHERSRWIKQITIGDKSQKLEQGRLPVKIKPGMNDVGEMQIEPKLLEWKR